MNKYYRKEYIKNNYQSLIVNKILKKRIPGHLVPIANYCITQDLMRLDLKSSKMQKNKY